MTLHELKCDRGALVQALTDAGVPDCSKSAIRCPFHEDENASGGIYQNGQGYWMVKCFPCEFAGDVVDVTQKHRGITFVDACSHLGVDPNTNGNGRPLPPTKQSPPQKNQGASYPSVDALAENMLTWEQNKDGAYKIHPYPEADGNVSFVMVRIDFDDQRSKIIRPVYRGDDGSWRFGDPPGPLPLYNLPEIANAELVIVGEGEKVSDKFTMLEFAATTSSHGSCSAHKTDWSPLSNKSQVVIFPDAGDAGHKYADDVLRCLAALEHPPKDVRVVNLPELEDGEDVVEWLDRLSEDVEATSQIEEMIEKAEPISLQKSKIEKHDHFERPGWKPFYTDVLPETLRKFVSEAARALNCDETFIALPVLSLIASVIGNSRSILLKKTWTEPSVLWTAVVADSGTLKSPAFDLALRPLKELQSTKMMQHAMQVEQFEKDQLRYESELRDWNNGGRKKGLRIPEKPEQPVAQRYLCSDITLESLSILLEENLRGQLVARDELSGLLKSFDAYRAGRGGDVAQWLEMHRAGSVTVDRKTGKRTTFVPRAAVSVCGTIQIGTLRNCLTPEYYENGLSARFLFASPPKRKKKWTEAELSDETYNEYARLVNILLTLEPDVTDDGQLKPVNVKLSPTGKKAWVRFYSEFADLQNNATGDLAKTLAKLEGTAARLALMFHLIRQAEGDETVGEEIDERSVESGAALAWWFANETKRLYGVFAESESERQDRELIEFIQRKGGSVTPREIQAGVRRYRNGGATDALERLAKKGYGVCEYSKGGKTGGRPSRIFTLSLNHIVNDTSTSVIDNGSIVDVDSVDVLKTHNKGEAK